MTKPGVKNREEVNARIEDGRKRYFLRACLLYGLWCKNKETA